MNTKSLAIVRHSVCAVGYIKVPLQEYVTAPEETSLYVVGTGFLINPHQVLSCAHVLRDLESLVRKHRLKAHHMVLEFARPPVGGQWATELQSFEVARIDDKVDLALLNLARPSKLQPIPVVGRRYIPAVGEDVALCGYAHGEVLLRQGKKFRRFGPVVQRGSIAALSPYDVQTPESVLLDLVTGPAASGSPVFRPSTGGVLGILQLGQIGKTAAFAEAGLIYGDDDGGLLARAEGTKLLFRGGRVFTDHGTSGGT